MYTDRLYDKRIYQQAAVTCFQQWNEILAVLNVKTVTKRNNYDTTQVTQDVHLREHEMEKLVPRYDECHDCVGDYPKTVAGWQYS